MNLHAFLLGKEVCRNTHTSIYEVRRKPFIYRGYPPNSLIFSFQCSTLRLLPERLQDGQ